MAATIKIKNSSTTGAVPTSSDLVQGELAVNVTDLGLYTENASGTVVKLNAPSIDDKGTGATKRLTIDTSGNLGLGVTPSAWATLTGLQVKNAAMAATSNASYFGANWYYNGGDKYIASSGAAVYVQNAGGDSSHRWYNAASGTAGNPISFTQAMTLDASGNLGVGTTSPGSFYSGGRQLVVGSGSGGQGMTIYTGTTSAGGIYFAKGTTGNDPYQGQLIYNHSNDAMSFITAASERARIDSSGNLQVGTTGGTYRGVFSGTASYGGIRVDAPGNGSYWPVYFNDTNATSGSQILVDIRRADTRVGYISTTNTSTSYSTSSDYRLKNTIAPMTGALAKVQQLKPCTYKWNADGSDGEGFIAHELAEVVPQCVTGEKDAVDENGNPAYQGIDTSFLVATLTAAIQEQQAIIQQLQADVAALKGQA